MAKYNRFSDTELVDLLRKEDNRAFIEIFDRYYVLLYSFACRRLDNKEIAKQLIYDAFSDIWAKRETVNIPGELISFLFTLIKNCILNYYKHSSVSQKYINHFQDYIDNNQDAIDHLVVHNDLSVLIEKEIAALPEKMRTVFENKKDKL